MRPRVTAADEAFLSLARASYHERRSMMMTADDIKAAAASALPPRARPFQMFSATGRFTLPRFRRISILKTPNAYTLFQGFSLMTCRQFLAPERLYRIAGFRHSARRP